MSYEPETPFDNIESAQEYVNYLLEATQEAHKQIETEIERAADVKLARRRQALQLVSYKLAKLERFEDVAPFVVGRAGVQDLLNSRSPADWEVVLIDTNEVLTCSHQTTGRDHRTTEPLSGEARKPLIFSI
jgi:hypothetical protein